MTSERTDRVIGLIAGQGQLPLLTAAGIRAAGYRVACVGLRGQYDEALPALCDEFATAGVIQLGRWMRLLRRWGVGPTVMIGRVKKARMYAPFYLLRQLPDYQALRLYFGRLRHDRRTETMLAALAETLSDKGIKLIDSTEYLSEQLAEAGVMTSRATLTESLQRDVDFGLPLVRGLDALGIGQAMAVKSCEVIAVEAVEGTNRMIERAGELCRRGGWTLIKAAGPKKDMRFDVPTVGVHTVESLAAAGGRCLAIEVGRVIMADKVQMIEAADRLGVALVGVSL